MLLAVAILPLIARIVGPNLLAISMLFIFKPVSFVARAISMMVFAKAVGLVIFPLTVVNISICVDKPTTAIRLVSLPVPLVERSIDPYLNTSSIFSAQLVPLTLVLCPII